MTLGHTVGNGRNFGAEKKLSDDINLINIEAKLKSQDNPVFIGQQNAAKVHWGRLIGVDKIRVGSRPKLSRSEVFRPHLDKSDKLASQPL